MAKKYIRSFLYLGIIILIFFVHDFVKVFIIKQGSNRTIWTDIPKMIFACAFIFQSLLFLPARKIATCLFIVFVIMQLILIRSRPSISGLISNVLFIVVSIDLIYKNIKELLNIKWFPVVYIHFVFYKKHEQFLQLIEYFFMKGKYKRIISLADRFPSYLSDSIYKYYYGVSKIMMNEYDDGERYLHEYLHEITDTTHNAVYYYLGLSAYNQNKFEAAIPYFTSYLTYNHDDRDALHFRAYMNSQIGYFDAAIQDYTAIINMDRNAGEFYYARGLCYKKQGDLINAKKDWLSAAQCSPPDEWALVRLAEIEKENNNPALALQYLKQAYKIDRTIKSECAMLLKELLELYLIC